MIKRTAVALACLVLLGSCSDGKEVDTDAPAVTSETPSVSKACEIVAAYESSHSSRDTPSEELQAMRELVSDLDAATVNLPTVDGEQLRSYMRSVAQVAEVDSDPASTGIEMAESMSTYYVHLKEVGESCEAAGSPIA